MRRIHAILAATTALALTGSLAACSDPGAGESSGSTSPEASASGQSGQSGSSAFDPASLAPVPEIEALVPASLAESGVLRVGSDTSYAPAEFLAEDGQTPIGYDVDLVTALAAVMGLSGGAKVQTAEFPTIIPALGTKYDIGASSYTITADRLQQVNMVSYVDIGSMYAVRAGNPTDFDPDDPCGATLGVQNGTVQFDLAQQLAATCAADGRPALTVMPLDLQTDVSTKVLGGQYDATMADTTVLAYTIQQSGGRLEFVGSQFDAAPQGLAAAKDDEQLATAVQAGLQYLMDNGYLTRILSAYDAQDVGLDQAQINPDVSE